MRSKSVRQLPQPSKWTNSESTVQRQGSLKPGSYLFFRRVTAEESSQHSKNFDSLGEINEIANDNTVTPHWDDQPSEKDGFCSKLNFDTLPQFTGYGKKKKDVQLLSTNVYDLYANQARRDAAMKLLKFMYSSKELRDHYLRKHESKSIASSLL